MSRSCRRLLAVCSLILLYATPLIGQETADRSSTFAATLATRGSPLTYASPIAPVPIPLPLNPPRRYPGNPDRGVLQQLIRAAGIIFSGRVTFIGQAALSSHPDPPSTAITFHVEHAIRGASTGQSLTIHEWAGLWTNGERYRVGQRVLLFLYSPGKLGLTSPVAGGIGRFAMDSRGQIVMTEQHVAFLAADPILGGKTLVPYADFALVVRRSGREE
jgi:hypothetical protein